MHSEATPVQPPVFDPRPDIRLIVTDMDGTLLDGQSQVHDNFWPLVSELHRQGILFCPASGRQYHTLREQFAEIADDVVFIAENGSFVMRRGLEVSSDCLEAADAHAIIDTLRRSITAGVDSGIVLCGKTSAYLERADPEFLSQVAPIFAALTVVDDLLDVTEDEFLKVSVFDFGDPEKTTAPLLAGFGDTHTVRVSADHWVDVTSSTANKGQAIRHLQAELDITADQTMVFGDFLNDLEMMDTASYSFAMDNAHPELRERASFIAPSNLENGVVRTVSTILGLDWSN
jgi:Cof subfamily protein (haloacid dehalogenase superfamily)